LAGSFISQNLYAAPVDANLTRSSESACQSCSLITLPP
jgi:hypothetical protein